MTNDTLLKILPYLIIVAFIIFCAFMIVELNDINAELEDFKKIIAEYRAIEIELNR